MAPHRNPAGAAMNTMRPARQVWMERAARSLLGLALVAAVGWALANGVDAAPVPGVAADAPFAAVNG